MVVRIGRRCNLERGVSEARALSTREGDWPNCARVRALWDRGDEIGARACVEGGECGTVDWRRNARKAVFARGVCGVRVLMHVAVFGEGACAALRKCARDHGVRQGCS